MIQSVSDALSPLQVLGLGSIDMEPLGKARMRLLLIVLTIGTAVLATSFVGMAKLVINIADKPAVQVASES